MPTILALRFPWGRYHATPWGRYVNEGAVEVPPSPWRLLRALYSVWRLHNPDLDAEIVHGLLARLAVPPTYALPPYRIAHTRHYYPDSKHRTGTPRTDKAIDAFAVLDGDRTIYVIWPCDLDHEEADALARLAKSLPYVGRADSTCDAELLDRLPDEAAAYRRAEPLGLGDEPPAPGTEQVELLAPEPPLDVEGLTRRPADIRARGLLYPPGSKKIPYTVPAPARPRPRPRAPRRTAPVQVVRLALSGPALPPLTETVPLMDAVRGACVKILTGRGPDPRGSLLVGKNPDGSKIASDHRHAHFLPFDADNDGRIDEVVVWTPAGLPDDELTVLEALGGRTVGVPEGVPGPRNLQARIAAFGGPDLLPATWTRPSTRWTSLTPFVPAGHMRPGRALSGFLRKEIEREFSYRPHLPSPHLIELTTTNDRWPHFIRHRWRRETRSATRPCHGLDLTFARPITGPIALGALAHFGLGLFQTAD